jgi:hypothetical protein
MEVIFPGKLTFWEWGWEYRGFVRIVGASVQQIYFLGGGPPLECAVATEVSRKMAARPNTMFRTILRPRAEAMRVTTERGWLCHLSDDRRVMSGIADLWPGHLQFCCCNAFEPFPIPAFLILGAGGRGYGAESLSFFQVRIANNWNNRVEEDDVGGACRRNGEKRNAYRLFVGKPEGKRPLGRSRRSWVYNIKIDLLEIGWGYVECACSTNGGEEERV